MNTNEKQSAIDRTIAATLKEVEYLTSDYDRAIYIRAGLRRAGFRIVRIPARKTGKR
jgi:hypothetical protein